MIKRIFLSTLVGVVAASTVAWSATASELSCVQPGTWHSPLDGRTLSTDSVLENLKTKDVVLLGESHNISDHHRWQMQIVAQLFATHPDMVLGFEAFPRRVQATLDKWVQGQLSESDFLKQSDWNTVWKFDPKLYMALFDFARINHIPMVALNVDRSLIHKISKNGWSNVPKQQRLGLNDPAPARQGYLDMLGTVFDHHGKNNHKTSKNNPNLPNLKDPHFKRFVEVQQTWDIAMAGAIASTLNKAHGKNQKPQMVAIIGRGHLDYGYGVPHQLKALGIKKVSVLSPWDYGRPCKDLKDGAEIAVADAVFGLKSLKAPVAPTGPKLGIMIENGKDHGVLVGGVLEKSIAERSSLQKNDIITMAAGQAIHTTSELIAIVKAMAPGTWLPLTVERNTKTIEIIAHFPAPNKAEKRP